MLNKKAPFFLTLLPFLMLFLLIYGCANPGRPGGGPRDVTPPRLLKASPPNMTRHFAAKVVQLDFDEFFKLYNQYTEITMSPAQDKPPEFKTKKKSIIITFKDTLQKNTTYVINFGKSIQDVNEGNTLKNFTYVFSTGAHIDSLSITGTVTNTVTQLKEKDITVMLFPIDKDSLYFGKKKPAIYTTTDTSGNFSLNNLHDGTYRIYALKESSPNRIYDNDKELIGFLKKPIKLYSDTSNIQLNLFQEDPIKVHVDKKFDLDGKMFFVFNKQFNNPSAQIIYPAALNDQKIVDFSRTHDTAYIYMRNMDFDSIRVAFLDNGKPIDSVSLHKGRKETFTRALGFGFNVGPSNKLKPNTDLILNATLPVESFDPTMITLMEDSTAVSGFTVTKDTGEIRKFYVRYHYKENGLYTLSVDEGAFTSIYGEKNKKLNKKFLIDKQENYSTVNLHVTVPDTSKEYIVQIYQDLKNILASYPITKNTVIPFKNYLTGKYHFRVIYDANKNGKWDSGNVKKKLQPENIWIDPKERTLRPNWESDEDLVIPPEPVTP